MPMSSSDGASLNHRYQRALRAFVRMVGNTINHETAHGFGVVSEVRANNSLTISGTMNARPMNLMKVAY